MSAPTEPIDEIIVTGQKAKDPAIKLNLGIDSIGDVVGAIQDPTAKVIEISKDLGKQGGEAWFDRTVSRTSRDMMNATDNAGLDQAVTQQAQAGLRNLNAAQISDVGGQIAKETLVASAVDRGVYSLASANLVAGSAVAGGMASIDSSYEQRTAYLAFVETAAENDIAGYGAEKFMFEGEEYTILVDATEDPDRFKSGEPTSIPFVIIDAEGNPISKKQFQEIEAHPDANDMINGVTFHAGYDILNINDAAGYEAGAYDDYINTVLQDPEMIETLTAGQAHEIVSNTVLAQDNAATWDLADGGIKYHIPSQDMQGPAPS